MRTPTVTTEPSAGETAPPKATSRQGNRADFALPPQCASATSIRIVELDTTVPNISNDPDSFTMETSSIDPGTYQVEVECPDGRTEEAELFVYRQTGAQRGGAKSVVLIGLLGLTSAAGVVGVPTLVDRDLTSRRGRRQEDMVDDEEDD